ncbi:MAG TPA: hypothetical protein VEM96_17225 [Pyrinomonadaceae bacterium]|nr:hypothetical protein [Pyrinomonadaceae bacterium]
MSTAIEEEYKQLTADLAFQQTKLKEQWDNAKQKLADLASSVKWRKFVAIVFRGVFVLGGFAISLGLPGYWPRIVGGMVTLVGLIDNQWLFNHEILMFNTPARNAFRKLLDKIANDFTDAFSPFPPDQSKSAAQNARLTALVSNVKLAKTALFNGSGRITDALDNKELGVLKKLAVTPETTAGSNTPLVP